VARRGIGNELVKVDETGAENEAATAILLEVRESNLAARGLYEKQGFREVGRRRGYYADPVEDAILYTLRFDRESHRGGVERQKTLRSGGQAGVRVSSMTWAAFTVCCRGVASVEGALAELDPASALLEGKSVRGLW
jgi:hypothetical protein